MSNKIKYREGYKYQLAEDYEIMLPELEGMAAQSDYISLSQLGNLTIKKSYAWDGASGPAIDDKTIMRGSLIHDALYQLMRECKLSQDCRGIADDIMRRICKEDGMCWFRRWYVHKALKDFAAYAAKPHTATIHEAP